ncbi:MAG: DUF2946 domain-containing protein [Rhodoferax sp.]|nr:DUF2946 domain-containing protein [Rhodoferax sp.]
MDSLRRNPNLIRLVLVWFLLTLGAAILSPLAKASDLRVICTSDGMVVQDTGKTSDSPEHAHTLDCPLCGGLALPILQSTAPSAPHVQVLSLGAIAASPIRSQPLAGPPPARAPPKLG